MSSAFPGLRVLDLSQHLGGAFAARLFGDFGADVSLAEPPDGHPLRHEPPFLDGMPGRERSLVHAYANWNKQSIVIADDAALAQQVADADVIVTTAPRSAARLGALALDAALAGARADAVHLCVTPHGLTGPLATAAGNNLTACARTGWAYINRYRDEPALQLPRDQAGYVGGVAGFIAAAAALVRRHATPACETVDVSATEALALTVHPWAIAAIHDGAGATNGPAGVRPRGAPGPLWDLQDGRMHFAIADFHHWREAMQALGLPELGEREDLVPDLGRHSKDMSAVAAGLAQRLPQLQRWPVFHALAELRCVCGVVQTIDEIPHNAQFAAREFLVTTHIDGRPVRAPGAPAKLSPAAWRLRSPAPALGAANESPQSRRGARAPSAKTGPVQDDAALRAGPRAGVRVLSFGQAWSGTFGSELLGLLGADVVQVGSKHRPDVWRRTRDRVPAAVQDATRTQHALNTQGLYNAVNLNKRELTLDLRNARGRELFWQLLPRFDVLLDNFRPTVMPGWGITLEKLHSLRPGMVWASVSGYGATGPYAAYPANGSTTEPMSGLVSIHGYEGDGGMNTGGLYPDPTSGYFLAASVIAALHASRTSGQAQRVDLSMMEALNVLCGDAVLELDALGAAPRPRGNRHPRLAPHNCYSTHGARHGATHTVADATPAQPEWVAISVDDDARWQALVQHVGDPRLGEPRFATMAARKANEVALDELLGAWCADRDAAQIERALCALGVAAARVVPLYELYAAPHPDFVARGFVTQVHHPEAGPSWLPGRPWRFSAASSSPVTPAPCVGQHSREVLMGELGISATEYDALIAAGVTGTLDD